MKKKYNLHREYIFQIYLCISGEGSNPQSVKIAPKRIKTNKQCNVSNDWHMPKFVPMTQLEQRVGMLVTKCEMLLKEGKDK